MERLTEVENGTAMVKGCGSKCKYGFEYCRKEDWENCKTIEDVIDKLAEYEDLEEQGRLIKLPCKVGDTVYRITDGMIQEFEINKFVVSYSIFNNEATVYMYFAGGHGGCSIDFYGVSVFGTQTEAEAKLKELRGEQYDGE